MFTDQSFEPVGFVSETAIDKSQTSIETQTAELSRKESANQSVEVKNVQTQTTSKEPQRINIDYDKLATFLKRIAPAVLEELDEIHGSTAFDGYDPGAGDSKSTTIELISRYNTLVEKDPDIKISSVAWSMGGGTLALAYSKISHEHWCDHLSKITFFNLTNEDKFPAESNKMLEINACVMTLSYHPTEPSILTAGLFNGDVLLWNFRDETSVTPVQICMHGDSVSVLQWRSRSINHFNSASVLVSASNSGYIMLHKLTTNFTTVELDKRFKINKEHNPSEKTRPRSAGGRQERAVEPGLSITSLAFCPRNFSIFIVGTQCGGLYKCDADLARPIEGDSDTFDPVVEQFARHEGSVTCISFSPTSSTFVTSGTDKEIRIFDLSQMSVGHVITLEDTVIGWEWFPSNSSIFATYGVGPNVTFYDVRNGRNLSDISLETKGKDCSCLQFNSRRDLIAIGDTRGNLEIWKIPRTVTS